MRPPGYASARDDLNLPPGTDLATILPDECGGCVGTDCDCVDFVICPVCGSPIPEGEPRGWLPGGEACCPGCEAGFETVEV